jgi:hypothetical protein
MNINIPTQLSEVSLIQFMKYNEYLNANKEITQQQADKKLLSVFCGLSLKEVEQIPMKDYKEIVTILQGVLQEPAKPLVTTYKGLGFIPNLDNVSVSEYVDLEKFYTEDESTIDYFMAVLYRPIEQKVIRSYSVEKYTGEALHIDNIHALPMDVVRSAIGFFLTLRDDLLTSTLKYSKEAK